MKPTIALVAVLAACAAHAQTDALEQPLKDALERHLVAQGKICLGKFDWPVAVSSADFAAGTNDALQMPVLETLGLVESVEPASTHEPGAMLVKQYSLTESGQRYYVMKDAVSRGANGMPVEHHRDLCPVGLTLDKIVSREPLRAVGEFQETILTYTYRVTAADWTRDPAAQKVFPMLARIVNGVGTQKLQQRMRQTAQGWIAIAPGG